MAQSLNIARGRFTPNYRSPGVYRLSQRIERRDIQLVRTDVAGFVGFAERGPLPSPDATEIDPQELAALRRTGQQVIENVHALLSVCEEDCARREAQKAR